MFVSSEIRPLTFTHLLGAGTPLGGVLNLGPYPWGGDTTTLSMATSYTPSKIPDDYRCFLLPWPEEFTADKYVTGFSVTPGNAKIVHHVIAQRLGATQPAPDQRLAQRLRVGALRIHRLRRQQVLELRARRSPTHPERLTQKVLLDRLRAQRLL